MRAQAGRMNRKAGYVLMLMLILASAGILLSAGLLQQGTTHMKIVGRQEALEEALFAAEGGCSMCMAYVMAGSNVPATLTGTIGGGTYNALVTLGPSSAVLNYTFCSTGLVRGVRRVVTMDFVHSRSWAEYALWYDHYAGEIVFLTGEEFWGKVHSNDPIYIYTGNAPVFHEKITSAATYWGDGSNSDGTPGNSVFERGYELGVPRETMSTINFTNTASTQDCLRTQADLVLTGLTSVVMSGSNVYFSNSNRRWTNRNVTVTNQWLLTNGLIYVASSGTQTGRVNIAGILDGRLTFVAEGDIYVTNHIRYTVHPTNNSNDALGLISRKDVIVATNCPANLDLFAHILATGDMTSSTNDGMFTVQNYNTRARTACQGLKLYGGIVENYRGPVGTSGGSGTGYLKQYAFDRRFATNPPPRYPVVGDKYYYGGWRDSP